VRSKRQTLSVHRRARRPGVIVFKKRGFS